MRQHEVQDLDELECLHLAFCDEYKLLKAIIEEPVDHFALTRAKLKLEQRSKKHKLKDEFISYEEDLYYQQIHLEHMIANESNTETKCLLILELALSIGLRQISVAMSQDH